MREGSARDMVLGSRVAAVRWAIRMTEECRITISVYLIRVKI